MKKNLYICSTNYHENKCLPNNLYDVSLCEELKYKKYPNCAWLIADEYYAEDNKLAPLPEQVYVFIKRVKQIKFDFYVYNENFFILTEKFLQFIQKHGFKEGYEICPAFLVNTGNKSLTDKKFYLMRIPDEALDKYENCIEYEEPVGVPRQIGGEDIYYKQIYTHLDLKILPFYTVECQYEGLAIDESLVAEIKETFEMPTVFSPQEWIEIIVKQKQKKN